LNNITLVECKPAYICFIFNHQFSVVFFGWAAFTALAVDMAGISVGVDDYVPNTYGVQTVFRTFSFVLVFRVFSPDKNR
jgi:hypothetical protein